MAGRTVQSTVNVNVVKRSLYSPNTNMIYWAAGIFEGEGSCHATTRHGTQVEVSQKDPWLLQQLVVLFGGTIQTKRNGSYNGYPAEIFRWSISGPRARGFLYTIFDLVSPRRQEQIRKTIEAWRN